MKKKWLLLLLIICIFSCNNSENQKSNDEIKTTSSDLKIDLKNKISSTTNQFSSLDLAIEVEDFITCKNTAIEKNDCRNSITKTISTAFRLTEFNDSKLGYVVYDSIHPIVERSKNWLQLGAINQENINQALAHTNRGGLALIIDTAQPSGHVVMIVSGENKKSTSWDMELPNVLSLANYDAEKSFSNKSLSYAMKKSNAIKIFLRQ